jgi:hypothetical protein
MVDLAIAYRIYPNVSKTPAVFAKNKFRLSELCLQSFRRALGSLRVKMWAILDGCPPEYEELFHSLFDEDELEIVQLSGAGNLATFTTQIDILTRQTESDLVYFAEDDYFYLPDALVKMVSFARSNGVEFVTPYDHPDYYDLLVNERHRIVPALGHHWRTSSSTCLTFLASKKSLLRLQRHVRTYSKGNTDGSMWLALTQKAGIFNPRVHPLSVRSLKLWIRTWYWGYRQILFDRSHELWGPVPSLATHMEITCLAPLVDWYAEFECACDGSLEPSVRSASIPETP